MPVIRPGLGQGGGLANGSTVRQVAAQPNPACLPLAPRTIPYVIPGIVNNVGTSVAVIDPNTYQITKLTASGSYDADAVGTVPLTGDFVVKGTNINGQYLFGVNSDPLTDSSYTSLDYSMRSNGTDWTIFENGAGVGTTGNGFGWIWRLGTTLYYGAGATFADAVASPTRTVAGATGTLYFDSTFLNQDTVGEIYISQLVPTVLMADPVTNAQTFFGPTASASNTLTPSLYSDGDTFLTPSIARGTVTLSPNLVSDGDTFFTPTVTSLYTLSPALVSDADTFFNPTVTASKTLTPGLVSNAQTFFTPTLQASYSLIPALVTDGDTFYGPTVTSSYALAAPLYVNGQSFFGPTVSLTGATQNLTAGLVSNLSSFPVPQVLSTAGGGGATRPRVVSVFFG